jgi:hypothetical protein
MLFLSVAWSLLDLTTSTERYFAYSEYTPFCGYCFSGNSHTQKVLFEKLECRVVERQIDLNGNLLNLKKVHDEEGKTRQTRNGNRHWVTCIGSIDLLDSNGS